MKTNKPIEDWIRQTKPEPDTSASMDSRVLMDSYVAMPSAQEQPGRSGHRRILMKRVIPFAAAAMILIAAVLFLTLFNTVSRVYAIEQTIAACHSVRSIRIETIIPEHEEPILVWAEFYDGGRPKSIRLNLPDWLADGAKDAVWKDNIMQVWFKKYNGILSTKEQGLANNILTAVEMRDPKTFMQTMLNEQKKGTREIYIQPSPDKTQPIRITATRLPDKEQQMVLYIDQETLLPINSEIYLFRDGKYNLFFTSQLYDYNQPIEPSIFAFDDLPADIIHIDHLDHAVGLEQGQMGKEQVAIETVSRFWQAIIDGDYDAAGQMMEGLPGGYLKTMFEQNLPGRIVKIVSVTYAQSNPTPSNKGNIIPFTFELEPEMAAAGGVAVSCILEIEKGGQIEQQTFEQINVGQVYNQPGRWTIYGGI